VDVRDKLVDACMCDASRPSWIGSEGRLWCAKRIMRQQQLVGREKIGQDASVRPHRAIEQRSAMSHDERQRVDTHRGKRGASPRSQAAGLVMFVVMLWLWVAKQRSWTVQLLMLPWLTLPSVSMMLPFAIWRAWLEVQYVVMSPRSVEFLIRIVL